MRRGGTFSSGLGVWVLSLVAVGAQPPASKTVWDGVYTKEQGRRGELISDGTCASCHGEKLIGGDNGPPLRGADFLTAWKGRSAAELLEKIRLTMPADSPGTLSAQRSIDIVAYILNANGCPPGTDELVPDAAALRALAITEQKP
jgi:mono/diheme cytochrome c family protein